MDTFERSSVSDIEKLYKTETNSLVKTKLLAVLYRKEKRTITNISKSLRMPESTIKRAINRFKTNGKNGLIKGHGGGNPGYLSCNQKTLLIKFIEEKNPTSKEINSFIKKTFGKSYHPFSIPRLMHSINFSRITPRKRHYKTDKQKQEEWKSVFKKKQKNTWIWAIGYSLKMNQ